MSFWEIAYKFSWASKADLQRAVQLKEISLEEYNNITGEEYVA